MDTILPFSSHLLLSSILHSEMQFHIHLVEQNFQTTVCCCINLIMVYNSLFVRLEKVNRSDTLENGHHFWNFPKIPVDKLWDHGGNLEGAHVVLYLFLV